MLIPLLVWWLVVISPDGSSITMEWRDKETCEFYHRLFMRIVGLKVTNCTEKVTRQEEQQVG
jgi:hypothetical protein